jgi:hypothetical protein
LDEELEGSAVAWVINRGKDDVGVYRLEFPEEPIDSRVHAPTITRELLLLPGEKKEIFRGPADLLICKFYSIEPGGAEIAFEVILSQAPRNPVSGTVEYAYGEP